jgi:hypothetical protein
MLGWASAQRLVKTNVAISCKRNSHEAMRENSHWTAQRYGRASCMRSCMWVHQSILFQSSTSLCVLTYVRPPISIHPQALCSLNLHCCSLPRVQNIPPGMVDSCWTLHNAMSDGTHESHRRGLSQLTIDSCVGGQSFDLSEAYTW